MCCAVTDGPSRLSADMQNTTTITLSWQGSAAEFSHYILTYFSTINATDGNSVQWVQSCECLMDDKQFTSKR